MLILCCALSGGPVSLWEPGVGVCASERGQPCHNSMDSIQFKITTGNKFYHVNRLIGLDKLNLGFIHFKKIMKIQFLKYGKT